MRGHPGRMVTIAITCVLVSAIALAAPVVASAYSYSGIRWNSAYTYWSYSNTFPLTSAQQTAVTRSSTTWNSAGSKWRFIHDEVKGDAMGWYVGYYRLTAGDGIGSTLVSYNGTTKRIVNCNTILNSYYPFSTSGSTSAYDVQNTMTHEFGHWLNLKDLSGSGNTDKTMYYSATKGETKKRSLASDDISGIRAIYGQ